MDNVPAKDYLWRDYGTFRPIGVPFEACTVVNLMYQDDPAKRMVIDDFQTFGSPTLASSGATVSMTVVDYSEGQMDDVDESFDHDPSDPFNGFTMSSRNEGSNYAADDSRGSIFSIDGNGDYDIDYSLQSGQRDFSGFDYLQFRAAQSSRHPLTQMTLGDVSFAVTLQDGTGATSTIRLADLAIGLEEPYQRTVMLVCGPGGLCCNPPTCTLSTVLFCGTNTPGWNNEFETVRLPLTAFQNNASGLDLRDVRNVTFNFGPTWGSTEGRIALDEIELTQR